MNGEYKLCIAIAEPTMKFAMPVAKEGEDNERTNNRNNQRTA